MHPFTTNVIRRRVIVIAMMMTSLVMTVIGLCVVTDGGETQAYAADPPAFVVIVSAQNSATTLERALVADVFLKKVTRWQNGDVIKPVDLQGDSATRDKFSHDVLKRSVAAVRSYWQQAIFSGQDVPPPELALEDDVVKYVQSHAGAIGYVSGTTHLLDTKVVTLR